MNKQVKKRLIALAGKSEMNSTVGQEELVTNTSQLTQLRPPSVIEDGCQTVCVSVRLSLTVGGRKHVWIGSMPVEPIVSSRFPGMASKPASKQITAEIVGVSLACEPVQKSSRIVS